RRHTRFSRDWSSDVCSSDLPACEVAGDHAPGRGGEPAAGVELAVVHREGLDAADLATRKAERAAHVAPTGAVPACERIGGRAGVEPEQAADVELALEDLKSGGLRPRAEWA